ncbi:hypothetical protein J7J26_04165 [Candidatus Micrarchaeota archaeon]|nr:hypothetical protein [Candidatus Micrarchaeota archaeon]
MDTIGVSTEFYPIRLVAYRSNYVELMLKVKNKTSEPIWIETDILLPDALSLSETKPITKARVRVGLLFSNDTITKPIKIYGNIVTYPNNYHVHLNVNGYDKYGRQKSRQTSEATLRCEKI